MHIAVVHGYFLKGTGSNLYVKNLCRELCRMGHEVSLFSQEQDFMDADFVTRFVEFAPDNKQKTVRWERQTNYLGQCTCYRPHLGGLLPVYVHDTYEGYAVKTYTELTKDEIEAYLDRNVSALQHCFTEHCPDMVLSNHTIMQPVYTARVCKDFPGCVHIMTVHGSCFNFSVRNSELLQAYAREAIDSASRIVFISDYSRQEFLDFFDDPMINTKAVVIPAGVDVGKFVPLSSPEEREQRLQQCLDRLSEKVRNGYGRADEEKRWFAEQVKAVQNGMELLAVISQLAPIDNWQTDQDAVERLGELKQQHNMVLYYGKYLWTKGVHLFVAAMPLILQKHPDTYFVLVGFGSFRSYLEALVVALTHGQRQLFYDLLSHPELFSRETDPNMHYLSEFLVKLQDPSFAESYFSAALHELEKRVIFTGFMEHEALKDLIAISDITVAPSVFPEAFGMVAIEALASGVIPVQTNHSGFAEVIGEYSKEFRDVFTDSKLYPLYLNHELVWNLAHNICVMLQHYCSMDLDKRMEIRRRAQHIAVSKYSWYAMAERYLAVGIRGDN